MIATWEIWFSDSACWNSDQSVVSKMHNFNLSCVCGHMYMCYCMSAVQIFFLIYQERINF